MNNQMSDKSSWKFLDDLKHRIKQEKPKEEKVGKIECLAPQFWEKAPPLKTVKLGGKNTWNKYQNFSQLLNIYKIYMLQKMVQIDQSSPQQWSE